MSEAPESLWADWDYVADDGVCGIHTHKKYASGYAPDCPPIQYTRTDLVQSQIDAAVAAEREACARLVGSMFAPGSEEEVTCDVAADAIRARGDTDAEALREARRVKPLEWKGRGAFCDFGVWQIATDDDGDFGYRFSGSPTVTFWHWKTEAEAKAAAQADYERRILSALIPEDT